MFSQTVEYALRVVVYLASEAPAARTTEQIHVATRVKKAYLSKILQGLARKGIVQTQRGVGGGVSLVKPPAELTILDVVNAVEPIGRIETCPLGLEPHGARLCSLHQRMDAALASVESAFAAASLADVLAESDASAPPLCDGAPQSLKLRKT